MISSIKSGQPLEKLIHAGVNDGIDDPEESGKKENRYKDHRCGSDEFRARGPGDVVEFLPDLAEEINRPVKDILDFLQESIHRTLDAIR